MSTIEAQTDEVTDEFERQFVLSGFPGMFEGISPSHIIQGYCQKGIPLKLRNQDGVKMLVVKSGTPKHRRQWEYTPPEEVYDRLWPSTAGRRMTFDRHTLSLGEYTLDVDVCRGVLEGLILLEVESPSEGLSERFEFPDWLAPWVVKEVTLDGRYRKRALATNGVIPDPFAPDTESLLSPSTT